jgi:diphosphoinositol-polyphosphate diphosphatase
MACVPIDRKEQRIMLISSKRYPDEWIIPKGGWESDESRERSAEREAWEEAGVLGRITRVLGRWDQYRRRHPDEIKSRFSVFELAVTETRDIWPEQSSRQRKWFTYEEAQAVLKRDWMLEAVRHAIHGTAQSASS